jgi:hypothetical protein
MDPDLAPAEPTVDALIALREAALSQTYVSLGTRRTSSPHEFYRYPARFSPAFARAAIKAFTNPGDLVLDPFVGGGTTLVEAMLLGRRSVGSDLNELATFVSQVKTTVLRKNDIAMLREWAVRLRDRLDLRRPIPSLNNWRIDGYLKDLDSGSIWRIRDLIALALKSVRELPALAQQDFARCVILRTAQWGLDMRSEIPSVPEFRDTMVAQAHAMIDAATLFADTLRDGTVPPIILTQRVPGLADCEAMSGQQPELILTSPPYPGVYVIYHRWKLRGRREIPAPYWITDRLDGQGMSAYTMGARADKTHDAYFKQLSDAFADLRSLTGSATHVVQIVGFNNVANQLDRYLDAMHDAGLEELVFPELATAEDGRLWRHVPSRRWWNTTTTLRDVAPHTAKEVVLIHRLAPAV